MPSALTIKENIGAILVQLAERADEDGIDLLAQVWGEVQAIVRANKAQAKALKTLRAANEELAAQRDAIAAEYAALVDDIGDGTILRQVEQGVFKMGDDLDEALYELRRALDDQARDNIIAEIGYILGHQWSDYSLRDLVALLTEETPAQVSYQRAEAFRRELRATYERVIEFGPEGKYE